MPELPPRQTLLIALAAALVIGALLARNLFSVAPPVVIQAPDGPSSGPASPRVHPPVEFTGPLSLNAATQEELERLPGIGPKLARRIVQDRALQGPYTRVEDLLRIRGIGPKLLERIRPYVRVP
ncbi:MAG: ComEA family DNA-binding protein [Armatimonadota bacterium]|nr:ComEA family DNA-binding protein [Armatimonadota bacterium]